MKIYYMPHRIFDALWDTHNQFGGLGNTEVDSLFSETYGIQYRSMYTDGKFIEGKPGHFTYKIVNEEKFALFILKFG